MILETELQHSQMIFMYKRGLCLLTILSAVLKRKFCRSLNYFRRIEKIQEDNNLGFGQRSHLQKKGQNDTGQCPQILPGGPHPYSNGYYGIKSSEAV